MAAGVYDSARERKASGMNKPTDYEIVRGQTNHCCWWSLCRAGSSEDVLLEVACYGNTKAGRRKRNRESLAFSKATGIPVRKGK